MRLLLLRATTGFTGLAPPTPRVQAAAAQQEHIVRLRQPLSDLYLLTEGVPHQVAAAVVTKIQVHHQQEVIARAVPAVQEHQDRHHHPHQAEEGN